MRRTHVFLASIILLAVVACTQAQDPDLLGWWKLDDGTGTVAADSSGNGNDGTFVGDPEWVAGKFGSGLLFDGQGGERVSLGGLDVPSGAMTITCSFKANNLDTPGNDPRIVSKPNGEILGAHIIGADASELIAEMAMAKGAEATVADIISTVHAHPTMAEAIHEAVLDTEGRAIHA